MGKQRLERARPTPLERLRTEIGAADRFITLVTWSCAAGMVLWSMLNATPYVRAHVAEGWENTAFVLPLVVDAAFVGALRADEIASRHGVKAGVWPVLLRLFTGASSVFLNIGHSIEKNDVTGVLQHLVAPGLLVLLAEAGPAWRRSLAAKLTRAEREAEQEERQQADRERRQRQEDENRRKAEQREEEDRQKAARREEEDRQRAQRREDEKEEDERRERLAASQQQRELERQRLALEAKKLEFAARPAPAPAPRQEAAVPVAVPAPAPAATLATPEVHTRGNSSSEAETGVAATRPVADLVAVVAAPTAPQRPAPAAVAASQTAPARVTARLDEHQEEEAKPAPAAGPVKDWDLPGLPATCAPGMRPELLTDTQVTARMDYGITQGWTQRRTGEFAGRSATVVNRHKQKRSATV
ncbi:DUF2637 domain-containing protein [Streptomyces nitrosporeus]|uniref:DUF2637 domain-containing protein n=1 Tax=Streptomyces nitrosporeus TaxID=28894 RepID=UPI00167D1F7D|nr:DUF2637 domain-containing protein [Streptomyces nitrosporeus]